MTDDTYINIRIKRTVKAKIERIAAQHKLNTGETLNADQVVEKAIAFLTDILFAEPEKAQAKS